MPASGPRTLSPVTSYVRMAALTTLVVALLVVVGFVPTRSAAGDTGVAAMLVGAGAALFGGLVGLLPPALFSGRDIAHYASGVLLGMALRMLVTLSLALGLRLANQWPAGPLLLWVGLAYIAILVVEGILLLQLKNRIAEGAR